MQRGWVRRGMLPIPSSISTLNMPKESHYLPYATEIVVGATNIATLAQLENRTQKSPITGARLVVPAEQYMRFAHDSTSTAQTLSDSVGRIPIEIVGVGTVYLRYFNA